MTKRSITGSMLGIFLMLPMAANAATFSIAVMTDSQFYAERHPEILEAQIDWIVANQVTENIVYLAQTGDLKDDQFCDDKTVNVGTGAGRTEWQIVDDAYTDLDTAGLAYAVAPGNHDFNPVSGFCPNWTTQRPLSEYNARFGPARFAGDPFYGDPLAVTPGNRVAGSNEDNFTLFDSNGIEFIAINLAFKPAPDALGLGSAELAWADNLLKTYPNRLGIVTSHYFLNTNDGLSPLIGPYGQEVYDTLSNNPNLFMMLSGHWYGEGWSSETAGRAGLPPTQILMANYQGYVFPDDGDAGTPANTPNPALIDFSNLTAFRAGNGATDAGFMRIMRFDTDTGEVDIETFIPPVVPIKNRTGTIVSTHNVTSGTSMGEFTASNLSLSFAGYVPLPSPTLFVAHGFEQGISRVEADGTGLVELVSGRSILDVSVDSGGGKMYWAELFAGGAPNDELRRSNIDGTGIELLDSRETINGVDLDLRAGKLYYAQPTAAAGDTAGVYQANLDGTARTLVAAGLPTFVAVDRRGQQVYWTNRTQGFIRRANSDGSGLQTLLSGEAEPQDIELDVASGHMYWTDTTTREVLRANLDGTARTVIIPASQFAAGTRPFGVALDLIERKLYWTVSDASPERIERSNLDGTGIEVVSNAFTKDVVGLDLVRLP